MRPVYATRVDVWPPSLDGDGDLAPTAPALDGAAVRRLVAARAATWAAEVVARTDPGAHVVGETVADVRIEGGSGRVRAEADAFDNAVGSAWRLAIESFGPPAGQRPGVQRTAVPHADQSGTVEPTWRAELTGRAWGDAVVLTIRVAAATGMPADTGLVPPALIPDLAGAVELGVDGEAVRTKPDVYDADEIDTLVDWLLGAERTLPLVIVSRHPDEGTAVSTDVLATRLATLAHVVELGSFGAAFALTDSVGKLFSCFNGAVRVYWPGLTLNDDPYDHPLWLAEGFARAPGTPEDLVAEPIIAHAALRIGPDRAVAPIEAEERRRRRTALPAEAPIAEASAPSPMTVAAPVTAPPGTPDWNAQLDALATMYGEDVARLEKRIDELEDVIRELQQARPALSRDRAGPRRAEKDGAEPARRTFTTVAKAVTAAHDELAGDHLKFHPNAFESAGASDFARPNDIYAALEDIAEVARRYHANEGLKRGFKGAFEEHGQTYKDDISPTTRGHHGDAYTFTWKGDRVIAGPHIGVGGPKPRLGWRIHWYVDEQDRAFVIWHVGRHLPWAGNS